MALDACMLIKQNGRDFEGSSTKTGHAQHSTIVYAVHHEITTPIDSRTGAPTKRQHGLLVAETAIDGSLYQIYNALNATGGASPGGAKLAVTFSFFRPAQTNIGLAGLGEAKPYLTIQLTDALIVDVTFAMPHSHEPTTAVRTGEYLVLKFAYRQIQWTYADGNKSAQDSWNV